MPDVRVTLRNSPITVDFKRSAITRHIRADESGELSQHSRHKMKYNRHGIPDRTTKVKNILNRISILVFFVLVVIVFSSNIKGMERIFC